MSNKIVSITEKVPQAAHLPDGNYLGTWGGYCIEVRVKERTYELRTEEGVRGVGIKVMVSVQGGSATFVEVNN